MLAEIKISSEKRDKLLGLLKEDAEERGTLDGGEEREREKDTKQESGQKYPRNKPRNSGEAEEEKERFMPFVQLSLLWTGTKEGNRLLVHVKHAPDRETRGRRRVRGDRHLCCCLNSGSWSQAADRWPPFNRLSCHIREEMKREDARKEEKLNRNRNNGPAIVRTGRL